MRRLAWLACATVVALGCKPKLVEMAEDYERATCACKHHDFACAEAARSTYENALETARARWYERKPHGEEWQPHVDAAKECGHRVASCSADDACGASWYCANVRADMGIGFCARIVGEGQACGGFDQSACAEGTWCKMPDVDFTPCDPGPCMPSGKCVKGSPPAGGADPLQILMGGAHPKPSASP